MSKKKHSAPHEEHADEGWLLPYSDMMTLLLALFIVMFAMSSVDEAKFNTMMEAMYTAFGGKVPSGASMPIPYPDEGLSDQPGDPLIQNSMESLYLSLNNYVVSNKLEDAIDVKYTGEHILVTLKNDVLFHPASAELSPEMVEQAHIMAKLLEENQDEANPFEVIVAGHTDTVPMNSAMYPSNWHLSNYRSLNFMFALLEDVNLDPTKFSNRGYGEYSPVADNDTEEGRQLNRRVELLITQPNLRQPSAAETAGEGEETAGEETSGDKSEENESGDPSKRGNRRSSDAA